MKTDRVFPLLGRLCVVILVVSITASYGQDANEQPYVKSVVIPPYPALARKAAVQGDVTVVLKVDSRGKVSEVSSIQGPPLLIDYVDAAAREWKFSKLSGEPVSVTIIFRFVLAGSAKDENVETRVRASLPELVEISANPPAPIGPDVEYLKRGRNGH